MKVICTINGHRAGIELVFTEKPDDEIRAKLKTAGFKWDAEHRALLAERSKAAFELAEKLTLEDAYDTEQELAVQMLDYEWGRMPIRQIPSFFQKLIDTGIIWGLRETYRRKAVELVSAGCCRRGETASEASRLKAIAVRTKMADISIKREKDMPAINAQIKEFEAGRMCNEDVVPFFQRLIDTELVLNLHGQYWEVARGLIKDGHCYSSQSVLKQLHAKKR